MHDIKAVLKGLEDQQAELEKQWEFLTSNRGLLEKCQHNLVFSSTSNRICIEGLSELKSAEQFMAELLGDWRGERGNTFYCFDAIATWKDPNYGDWEIWLQCSIEDFPAELLPEGHVWVKSTTNDYHTGAK